MTVKKTAAQQTLDGEDGADELSASTGDGIDQWSAHASEPGDASGDDEDDEDDDEDEEEDDEDEDEDDEDESEEATGPPMSHLLRFPYIVGVLTAQA